MDPTINLLQMGLNGAQKRQEAISNNIANVDTPNYKRKDVDFLSVLKKETNFENDSKNKASNKIRRPKRPTKLGLSRTQDEHIDSSKNSTDKNSTENFAVNTSSDTKYRNDNNNVDIDYEMAELAKTNLYYSTLAQRISGKFSNLNNVISKGGS